MSTKRAKIVTTLRERQQIEQSIQHLTEARSEKEFKIRAEQIAASGEQVIPVILNNLKRSSPQLLNVLGVISSLYPDRDAVVDRLYQVASNLDTPDKNRVAALLILERFLGVEPDPDLIGTLQDPQAVIVDSIKEMLHESEREPLMLLDYIHGLAGQDDEGWRDVIETLLQVGKERAVPALSLLAQEVDENLSTTALRSLGKLYCAEAVWGLQALLPVLPPGRRPLAERSLRKLQFSGLPVEPLPCADASWRTLVSPLDGEGNQAIWFIHQKDDPENSLFVGISLTEEQGIAHSYGNYNAPTSLLPARQAPGYIHSVSPQEGTVLYMLETEFEYGLRLVSEGQARNFEVDNPLPPEYRLLGTWVWGYAHDHLERSKQQPALPDHALERLSETTRLLDHQGFAGWLAYGEEVSRYALTMLRWSPFVSEYDIKDWSPKLAETYFNSVTLTQMQGRLEKMAEWLLYADEPDLAQVAIVAAQTLTAVSPAVHPFTLRLAQMGLRATLDQLKTQFNLGIR